MKKIIEKLKNFFEPIRTIINKKFLLYYLAILILLCGSVSSYYLIKYSNLHKSKKVDNSKITNIDYIRAAIIERSLSDIKKNEYQNYLKSNELINQNFIYRAETDLRESNIKNENNFRNFIAEKFTIKSNINEIKLPKQLYMSEYEKINEESKLLSQEIKSEKGEEKLDISVGDKKETQQETIISQPITQPPKKIVEKEKSSTDEISKLIQSFEMKKSNIEEPKTQKVEKISEIKSEKIDTGTKESEIELKKGIQPSKLKIITKDEDILFQPKIENIKRETSGNKTKEETSKKQKEFDNFSLIKLLE
ncbi:MAG TPA: hypothetical protein PLD27_03095 [bacterium]|nr:hypothetical protein [bacterium]HOL47339.1 hypothetical protein [bacterium]HPQ17955.1 hypothetical protein [bacterium]